MTYKTYNIELVMTENTSNHWMSLLAQTRDAFNLCANIISSENIKLQMVPVHAACYDRLRQAFPQIPSQGIIRVQKSVLAAFRTIKRNKHKKGSVPQKKSLSLQLDKRLYSNLSINGISLSDGRPQKREFCTFVLYDKVRELFSSCTFTDPTVFARDGRLFLSVPFEVAEQPCTGNTSVGVDLGIKRLFVTSEGKAFADKRYLKERRKARYLKRCLQSRGTKSSRKHLKHLRHRERSLSRGMVERACSTLLRSTDASIIVLEDLSKIKSKTSKTSEGYKRKRHNNMLSQVPFYLFKERLTYKATLVGRQVVSVSPAFTSQTDSRTNKRDGNRVGCRYYCSDGTVLDADWNAAVNIALRANHPLSSSILPLSGRVQSITQSSEAYRLGQAHKSLACG